MDLCSSQNFLGSLLSYDDWLEEKLSNTQKIDSNCIAFRSIFKDEREKAGIELQKRRKEAEDEQSESSLLTLEKDQRSIMCDSTSTKIGLRPTSKEVFQNLITRRSNSGRQIQLIDTTLNPPTSCKSNEQNHVNYQHTNMLTKNNIDNIETKLAAASKNTKSKVNGNATTTPEGPESGKSRLAGSEMESKESNGMDMTRLSTMDSLKTTRYEESDYRDHEDKYLLLLEKIRRRGFEPKTLGEVLKSRNKQWAKTQCIHASAKEDFIRHLQMYKNQFKSYNKTPDGWIAKDYHETYMTSKTKSRSTSVKERTTSVAQESADKDEREKRWRERDKARDNMINGTSRSTSVNGKNGNGSKNSNNTDGKSKSRSSSVSSSTGKSSTGVSSSNSSGGNLRGRSRLNDNSSISSSKSNSSTNSGKSGAGNTRTGAKNSGSNTEMDNGSNTRNSTSKGPKGNKDQGTNTQNGKSTKSNSKSAKKSNSASCNTQIGNINTLMTSGASTSNNTNDTYGADSDSKINESKSNGFNYNSIASKTGAEYGVKACGGESGHVGTSGYSDDCELLARETGDDEMRNEGMVWSSIIFCPNFRPGGEIVHRYSRRTEKTYNTLYKTIKDGWVHPNLLVCLIRDATHPVRFATPPDQDCYTAIYTGPEISESMNTKVIFGEYTGIVYREDSIPDSIFEYAFELNFTSASWVDAELEYRNDKQYIRDMNGTIFLPNNSKYVLDSSHAFNELSMVNHCQSIGAYGGEYFLQANCEWQQVIFDGWPHVILTNKQGVKIQTGDELIADFGALWFQKVEENCHRQLKRELIQYRLLHSNLKPTVTYEAYGPGYLQSVRRQLMKGEDGGRTEEGLAAISMGDGVGGNVGTGYGGHSITGTYGCGIDASGNVYGTSTYGGHASGTHNHANYTCNYNNNATYNDHNHTPRNYDDHSNNTGPYNHGAYNDYSNNHGSYNDYTNNHGAGSNYNGNPYVSNRTVNGTDKARFELLRQELPVDKSLDDLDVCVVNNNTSYVCAICLDEDLNVNPNTSTKKLLQQRAPPNASNMANKEEMGYRDDEDEDECIVCDGCDRIFHTKCLQDVTSTAMNYIQMDVYGAKFIDFNTYLKAGPGGLGDKVATGIGGKLDLSLRKWYCMYCRYLCKQIIQHDLNQDFMPLQSCIYVSSVAPGSAGGKTPSTTERIAELDERSGLNGGDMAELTTTTTSSSSSSDWVNEDNDMDVDMANSVSNGSSDDSGSGRVGVSVDTVEGGVKRSVSSGTLSSLTKINSVSGALSSGSVNRGHVTSDAIRNGVTSDAIRNGVSSGMVNSSANEGNLTSVIVSKGNVTSSTLSSSSVNGSVKSSGSVSSSLSNAVSRLVSTSAVTSSSKKEKSDQEKLLNLNKITNYINKLTSFNLSNNYDDVDLESVGTCLNNDLGESRSGNQMSIDDEEVEVGETAEVYGGVNGIDVDRPSTNDRTMAGGVTASGDVGTRVDVGCSTKDSLGSRVDAADSASNNRDSSYGYPGMAESSNNGDEESGQDTSTNMEDSSGRSECRRSNEAEEGEKKKKEKSKMAKRKDNVFGRCAKRRKKRVQVIKKKSTLFKGNSMKTMHRMKLVNKPTTLEIAKHLIKQKILSLTSERVNIGQIRLFGNYTNYGCNFGKINAKIKNLFNINLFNLGLIDPSSAKGESGSTKSTSGPKCVKVGQAQGENSHEQLQREVNKNKQQHDSQWDQGSRQGDQKMYEGRDQQQKNCHQQLLERQRTHQHLHRNEGGDVKLNGYQQSNGIVTRNGQYVQPEEATSERRGVYAGGSSSGTGYQHYGAQGDASYQQQYKHYEGRRSSQAGHYGYQQVAPERTNALIDPYNVNLHRCLKDGASMALDKETGLYLDTDEIYTELDSQNVHAQIHRRLRESSTNAGRIGVPARGYGNSRSRERDEHAHYSNVEGVAARYRDNCRKQQYSYRDDGSEHSYKDGATTYRDGSPRYADGSATYREGSAGYREASRYGDGSRVYRDVSTGYREVSPRPGGPPAYRSEGVACKLVDPFQKKGEGQLNKYRSDQTSRYSNYSYSSGHDYYKGYGMVTDRDSWGSQSQVHSVLQAQTQSYAPTYSVPQGQQQQYSRTQSELKRPVDIGEYGAEGYADCGASVGTSTGNSTGNSTGISTGATNAGIGASKTSGGVKGNAKSANASASDGRKQETQEANEFCNAANDGSKVSRETDSSVVGNVVDYLNCRYLAGMWQLEPFAIFGEAVRVCVECNRKCGPKANVYVCRILKRHLGGNFDHPKATNVEQMRELILIAYEQHVSYLLRLLVLKNVTIDFLVKLALHFITQPFCKNQQSPASVSTAGGVATPNNGNGVIAGVGNIFSGIKLDRSPVSSRTGGVGSSDAATNGSGTSGNTDVRTNANSGATDVRTNANTSYSSSAKANVNANAYTSSNVNVASDGTDGRAGVANSGKDMATDSQGQANGTKSTSGNASSTTSKMCNGNERGNGGVNSNSLLTNANLLANTNKLTTNTCMKNTQAHFSNLLAKNPIEIAQARRTEMMNILMKTSILSNIYDNNSSNTLMSKVLSSSVANGTNSNTSSSTKNTQSACNTSLNANAHYTNINYTNQTNAHNTNYTNQTNAHNTNSTNQINSTTNNTKNTNNKSTNSNMLASNNPLSPKNKVESLSTSVNMKGDLRHCNEDSTANGTNAGKSAASSNVKNDDDAAVSGNNVAPLTNSLMSTTSVPVNLNEMSKKERREYMKNYRKERRNKEMLSVQVSEFVRAIAYNMRRVPNGDGPFNYALLETLGGLEKDFVRLVDCGDICSYINDLASYMCFSNDQVPSNIQQILSREELSRFAHFRRHLMKEPGFFGNDVSGANTNASSDYNDPFPTPQYNDPGTASQGSSASKSDSSESGKRPKEEDDFVPLLGIRPGRSVLYRKFSDGYYQGIVSTYGNSSYFKIEYSDGDDELMDPLDLLNELVGNLNNIKSVLLQLSSNDIRNYQYLLLLRGHNVNSAAGKDRLEELCTQLRNYMLNQLVHNKVGSRKYKKRS